MRPMNLIPAAAGLVLALAAGTPAAPISPDQAFGAHGADWIVPTDFPPRPDFWGHHHGHRPHRTALQTLLLQNGHSAHGPVGGSWGPGRSDEEDLMTSWLCGGTGGPQELAEGPHDPVGEESDPEDADGSPTVIASDPEGNPQQPMVPAVPEPGSLALLGAGALGLLAAHALLKKP